MNLRDLVEPEPMWRKTIVCRPEDEEAVTAAAELAGRGFRIRTSRLVPSGRFFLIDDEKLDDLTAPIRVPGGFRVWIG